MASESSAGEGVSSFSFDVFSFFFVIKSLGRGGAGT